MLSDPWWGLLAVDGMVLVQVDDRGEGDPGVVEQVGGVLEGDRSEPFDAGSAAGLSMELLEAHVHVHRGGRQERVQVDVGADHQLTSPARGCRGGHLLVVVGVVVGVAVVGGGVDATCIVSASYQRVASLSAPAVPG